ncbi:MAG: ATP-dependent DNA helicase RecQ [Spirochaetales bacterium]|nr:ATP-dependent DNA helicase RecQ [Spirochaetales bacterium]
MKTELIKEKTIISPLEAPRAIPDALLDIGCSRFGITYLFPYQRLVIQNIMDSAALLETRPAGYIAPELSPACTSDTDTDTDSRSNQIVILPTGAGKSLCFMLPGALLPGITLIIFPLLALMADQLRRIERSGLKGVMLRGGQEKTERDVIWKELDTGKVNFILTNPETLKGPNVMARLKNLPLIHAVIDEAHTVNEWGKSFRPSYLELGKTLKELKVPIVTAFTATASPEVMLGIKEILFPGQDVHTITGNPDRENITYRIIPTICPEYDLSRFLLPILQDGSPNPEVLPRPAIVFCVSRTSAELTAARLRNASGEKDIYFYHAGLSREEKTAIEEWFFSSENGILASTCAYGMGVDKSNIRTVIHREPPCTVEAYLQESGRGGRDRQPAMAVMLLPWDPRGEIKDGQSKIAGSSEEPQLPPREAAFREGIRNNGRCRREVFIELLGGESEYCAGCDVCDARIQKTPRGAAEIMKILKHLPRYYNKRELQFLLAGRGSTIIREENLYLGRYFGLLKEWEPDQIADALIVMQKSGMINKGKKGVLRGKLRLTKKGKYILKTCKNQKL